MPTSAAPALSPSATGQSRQRGGRHVRPGRLAAAGGRRRAEEKAQASPADLAGRRPEPAGELGSQAGHDLWRAVSRYCDVVAGNPGERADAAHGPAHAQAVGRADDEHERRKPLDRRAADAAGRPEESRRRLSVPRFGAVAFAPSARERLAALHPHQARPQRLSLATCRLFGEQTWRAGAGRRQAADPHRAARGAERGVGRGPQRAARAGQRAVQAPAQARTSTPTRLPTSWPGS